MINPLILVGLVLAGAWASALCAADDELERDRSQERIDTKVGNKADSPELPVKKEVTKNAHVA
jgi:hypothetical protein